MEYYFCMKKLNYLKEARLARGITQEDLAERMGLTQGAVQKHESGTRKLDLRLIQQYAAALICDELEIILGPQKNNELIAEATTILQGFSSKDQEKFVDMLKLFAKKDE